MGNYHCTILTNLHFIPSLTKKGLFVPFDEVIMEAAAAPQAQAAPATQAPAPAPLAPTPAPSAEDQAKEFLTELTKTKDKLKEAEQREKDINARLARLQELEAKEELRAKEYAAMQQPKLEQFVARLEASKGGKKLDERVFKAYERTFCDPNLKGAFEDQWALHTAAVNAEAKQREQETLLKKMEEELKKKDTVMRDATHQMRSSYVPVSAAAEQERMMKEDDAARRQVVSINASLKEKTHAIPAPHANELPFMEAYREMMSASVTASSGGGGGGSSLPGMRTHTQAAPVHAHIFDPETGERQIYGMRADFPHLFDTMCDEKFGLVTSDLEPMVQMNEKRCWIDNSKRVDALPGTGII